MTNLGPAAQQMAALVAGVRDDQLASSTPCEDYTLEQLLSHVDGLSQAFRAAAEKEVSELTTTAPDAAPPPPLAEGWRDRVGAQLEAMATAWDQPEAVEGTTQVGGSTAPAAAVCGFGLNELVVHGWDVARASGQDLTLDETTLDACYGFAVDTTPPGGIPDGPFGTPVDVPDDAPVLDRIVALRGRDPGWTAGP